MGITIIKGTHVVRNIKGKLELKELSSDSWISIGDFQLMVHDSVTGNYKLFLWKHDHIPDYSQVCINKIDMVFKLIYVTECSVIWGRESHVMERLPKRWYSIQPSEGNYWAEIQDGKLRFYTDDYVGFTVPLSDKIRVSSSLEKTYHIFNSTLDGWYEWSKVHVDVVDGSDIMFTILNDSIDAGIERYAVERFHLCSVLFDRVNEVTLGISGNIINNLKCISVRVRNYSDIVDKVESIVTDAFTLLGSPNELSDTFINSVNNVLCCICGEPTLEFVMDRYKNKKYSRYLFHCIKYDKSKKVFVCYFLNLSNNSVYTVREILNCVDKEVLYEENLYSAKN